MNNSAALGASGLTILIDGKTNGGIYYGERHAAKSARSIRTRRANKGEHPEIVVLNLATGARVAY